MSMDSSDKTTRVLLVEDSEDDAELVMLELERAGLEVDCHRVCSADNLRSALLEERWDIIISDFAMPDFNGLEAFQLVKSLGVDVPFIFVSGALGEERAVEAMRAGARDYLLKDNLKRLAEAVRRELNEVASRRERRRAEELARREARRLSMAVEASGAGIYEHRVPPRADSYHSDRWAEILGFRPDELPRPEEVPGWFEDRIHEEDRPELALAHGDFLAGRREGLEIETRVAHKDGSWVSVALFCKPVERDPAGRATHVAGVMLDLTQRRKLEDQLRQAQKMEAIGRLAGGVAHDFNNLLTVIYSFGGFVIEELAEGSPARSDMQEVLDAARRAAGLTGQLLAFSRRQTIEPRVLCLNEMVSGIDKMLRRVLGEDIDFATELSPGLGNVRVDPSAFEQVLVNLAINARDAMVGGGKLTIETFNRDLDQACSSGPGVELPPGRYVGVAVSDNGAGMEPEIVAQIFEPFFTTKAPGKGTGLGLSTCYGIVKQASGYILVYSEVGQGTTVRVLLPRVIEAAEPAQAEPAPVTLDGNEIILIAEDDEQVRRLSVRALSQRGYRVIEAENGEQALQVCRRTKEAIHLLLTDVVMPTMGGKQLAAELVALHPEMKVLYMSGYTANAIVHHGVLEPETTMLQKPFTPEHLLRRVRAILDRG
jgi:two-component system, cell cycle sensor histidine kinase and response regulator CckA